MPADFDWSTAQANSMLDAEFRANKYLALWSAVPAADGSGGTEISVTGYSRVQLTTSNMAAASSRSITNSATITHGTASSGPQSATHWTVMSASSGGTMTTRGELGSTYVISNGTVISFAPGQITISLPTAVT